MSGFEPRPAQKAILEYEKGTMGIAAVPGSGKTWTLSQLASSLILKGGLERGQEVLIVTLVNAAVDNFRQRIAAFLEEKGLLPGLGYRVRTLHSLAHEIVSMTPSAAGLAADFSVIDERVSDTILKNAFRACYPRYELAVYGYLKEDLNEFNRRKISKDQLPDMLRHVIRNGISHLKNRRVSVKDLNDYLGGVEPSMAHLVRDVYERYQQGLATRGSLDFDDLITTAIDVLEHDSTLVARLQQKWPYILEDEAQDSSELQEQILRHLTGPEGSWVRVGDPNQAIYETFTTAHPKYLKQFLEEADFKRDLPNSGRSGRPIINLANELIRWVREEHPVQPLRDALDIPYIEPTPPGDPQPNPLDEVCKVGFVFRGDTNELELNRVIESIKKWLPAHQTETVAMLVPTHAQGADAIRALDKAGIPFTDALLRLTTSTREAAGALSRILEHLAHPASHKTLATVYRVWFFRVLKEEDNEATQERLALHLSWLQQCEQSEAFIWPSPTNDWLEEHKEAIAEETAFCLGQFRHQLQQWQRLVLLPIGEMLTAIAQTIFDEPEKLAMTQLFGEILSDRSQYNLGTENRISTLDELQRELVVIAKDQRRLRSIEADKSGFDPEDHKGEIVVATMHGAKGLEWDRVYMLSVSDYDFPAGLESDSFRAERWFIRNSLSLDAETIAQLDSFIDGTDYEEGVATQEARYDYARERLRLLYVGITRARKELMVTSNVGRRKKNEPALAFNALKSWLDNAATPDNTQGATHG
ncbi:MAG: ATP-dependent helicase [Rhodothermales bacterium]